MMLTFDAKAIARLEKHYSTPQIVEQRRRLRAIVAPRPGESGLDVGCGVAFLACELAREIAPGGRVAAIDKSSEAVEASKVRIGKEGLEATVVVRAGDAADLPFSDGQFDFVVGAQVYCYVPDIGRAIREAARVLRKGGRFIVLDSDWDLCVFASGHPATSRKLIAARSAQFAHAHLPRDLHALVREAGMTLSDAQCYSIVETRYDPDSYSAGLISPMREAALKQGVPPDEIAGWMDDLESRKAEGKWFFCLNRFIFTAKK